MEAQVTDTTFYIAELIISLLMIIVVLLQAKGTTASAFFTRDVGASYRTRRGLERTLFTITIALAVLFLLLALLHNTVGRS
jgi:preprotein translocase subunit SecG